MQISPKRAIGTAVLGASLLLGSLSNSCGDAKYEHMFPVYEYQCGFPLPKEISPETVGMWYDEKYADNINMLQGDKSIVYIWKDTVLEEIHYFISPSVKTVNSKYQEEFDRYLELLNNGGLLESGNTLYVTKNGYTTRVELERSDGTTVKYNDTNGDRKLDFVHLYVDSNLSEEEAKNLYDYYLNEILEAKANPTFTYSGPVQFEDWYGNIIEGHAEYSENEVEGTILRVDGPDDFEFFHDINGNLKIDEFDEVYKRSKPSEDIPDKSLYVPRYFYFTLEEANKRFQSYLEQIGRTFKA